MQGDLAIIGTTNLNSAGHFCCDHEDEAQIKSRLLGAARIRCIAADSNKLLNPGRGSSWVFALFSRFSADLILTDTDILKPFENADLERLRQAFFKRTADQGVLVLTENETTGALGEQAQVPNPATPERSSGRRRMADTAR